MASAVEDATGIAQNASLFQSIFEQTAVGIAGSDIQGRFLFANPKYCEIVGRSESELLMLSMQDITHPDDLPGNLPLFEKAIHQGQPFVIEKRYVRPDGSFVWVNNHVSLVTNIARDDAPYKTVVTVTQDITLQKQAKEGLKETEARYRAIDEAMAYGIWMCNPQGEATYASESFLRLLGQTWEECQKFGWVDKLPPEDVPPMLEKWRHSLKTGDVFNTEHWFLGTDGKRHPVLARGVPVRDEAGNITSWVGINLDISQLKQVEAALKESETRFRLLADQAPMIIWQTDQAGNNIYVNKAWYAFTGQNEGDNFGEGWARALHPDDREKTFDLFYSAVQSRQSYETEYRLKRHDGHYCWFFATGAPRYTHNGEFLGYIGTCMDITVRKNAEEEVRASNHLLSTLSQVQSEFISGVDSWSLWEHFVDGLLKLTRSEYGYVAEVLYKADGSPYLKFLGLTNIAWNPETRELFEGLKTRGLEFHNLENLFGWGLKNNGSIIIANDPANDPRRGGLPAGHPPLRAFMGLPIYGRNGKLVGQLGLANCPDGYTETLAKNLEPLSITCGNMLEAYRDTRLRQEAEEALKKSEERYQTLYKWEKKTRQVLQQVRQSLDLEEIYTSVVQVMTEALNIDRCFIVEFGYQNEILPVRYEYCRHPGLSSLQGIVPPWEASPYRDISLQNQLAHTSDTHQEDNGSLNEAWRTFTSQYGLRGMITAPISYHGNLINVLVMHTAEPRAWQDQELFFAKIVTDQISVSLYQAKVREELVRASQMKSQFVSNMSHELRTPLNSVIGYTEMLLQGMTGELNEKQRKYLQNVHGSGKHLLDLVNDVLDMSKVEAGKLELNMEWFDIRTFMIDIQAMFVEMAQRNGIRLTFDIEPDVDGLEADKARLKQILINLISNAIKFNRENGSVTIRIFKSEDRQCTVFEIQDTGIGIPAAKLPELFTEFYQVDNSMSRSHEGTGLGLALTKRLVELHHGQIFVESREGQGSTFTFKLPTRAVKPQ